MLPHQGAGANTAIEDAEALSAYLFDVSQGSVSDSADIQKALDHVFRVRFRRATRWQMMSRRSGLRSKETAPSGPPQWEKPYPGAVEWEKTRPEMVLREGEETMYDGL